MKRFRNWRQFLRACAVRLRAARRSWSAVRVRFEFVPRDSWVGVYWRRRREAVESGRSAMATKPIPGTPAVALCNVYRTELVERDRLDVWVCLLPFVPLRVTWRGPKRLRRPGWEEQIAAARPVEAEGAREAQRLPRTAVFAS